MAKKKQTVPDDLLMQIRNAISAENSATSNFTNLSAAMIQLQQDHNKAFQAMQAARQESNELRSQLEQEYGEVNINVESGEITPISEETGG